MPTSRLLKLGSVFAALLLIASLSLVGAAEARMGGSFGSRGMRTFSSPSITRIAPESVSPIQRSMTPNTGGYGTAAGNPGTFNPSYGRGGFLSGLGGGLLGGMLGGLFFHGLFGSMLGYGFGGIGGGFSALFQLVLIGGLIWLAMRWFRNQQPAAPRGYGGGGFPFGSAPSQGGAPAGALGNGYGSPSGGPAGGRDEIGVTNTDFETFERILGDLQQAFSREDHRELRRFTTPEMVSYLSEELADNATHGLRNDVTDLQFLEGELAEAWREGSRDYATVAMRWTAIDVMRDRQSGAVMKGDPDRPVEARELWTFVRENGGAWQLSAIQDAR